VQAVRPVGAFGRVPRAGTAVAKSASDEEVEMAARWCSLVMLGLGLVGCAGGCRATASPPSTEVYAITLGAGTVKGLPRCAPALAGDTAYVQSPAGLYSCQSSSWMPIPCTRTGAVAFSSATQTVLACADGGWTLLEGEAGTASLVEQLPVPPSSTCRFGGTEVKRGVDLDGDGALGDREISSDSFVCNGERAADPDPQIQIKAEPAGANCPAGGKRVDVSFTVNDGFALRSAYVCDGTPTART
jgi:hypothetical protein